MNALFKPLLLQSFRAGGLALLVIALSLAIAATTALKLSNGQIQQAVSLQAASMLGADLVLSDHQPLAQQWKQQASEQQLKQADVTVFSSMARKQDQFVMVNVKAIDARFPLRGQLQIQPQAQQLKQGEIWLSPRAMDLLKAQLGSHVFIADGEFVVTGVIAQDSNQELGFSGFSPTVIINQIDIAQTHAIQVGSRIEYRLLMSGSAEQIKAFELYFKQQKLDTTSNLKLRNAAQANNQVMKPLENLATFLQLANILAILLCGIAIALTSQRYVQQNQDHIALMRCLGATRRQIFSAYFALLGVVSMVSVVIGSLVGAVLGLGLLQLMLQLIPQLHLTFSMWAFIQGPLPIAIFTSIVVMAGFVLPSIWELLGTAPIRVIRQYATSSRRIFYKFAVGLLSLIVFSLVLSENIRLSAMILAAILVLTGVLYTLVYAVLIFLKQRKNRFSVYVRIPKHTALQVTALALGLSLMASLMVLRSDLLQRWQQQLPANTPNQFVYGLPPQSLTDFEQQLHSNHWQSTPLYPNIRGRLIAKNGQAFDSKLIKDNNALRRELNLTQTKTLPKDNIVVTGQRSFRHKNQVSIEEKLAQELNIKVGDQLTFELPEGALSAQVTNIRRVEWESFSPNFFFIFAPETFDETAGSYLGSFYVPPNEQQKLVPLIENFSNTVFIDVGLILQQVKNLVAVLVQIMTVLAVLVGVSGLFVLVACLNLLLDERRQEVALMRSFGMAKQKLKQMLALEIGFIGLLAGLVACCFAEVISVLVSLKMQIPLHVHAEIWLILPAAMMLTCAFIGRYRLSYLCDLPPLHTLREINQ